MFDFWDILDDKGIFYFIGHLQLIRVAKHNILNCKNLCRANFDC